MFVSCTDFSYSGEHFFVQLHGKLRVIKLEFLPIWCEDKIRFDGISIDVVHTLFLQFSRRMDVGKSQKFEGVQRRKIRNHNIFTLGFQFIQLILVHGDQNLIGEWLHSKHISRVKELKNRFENVALDVRDVDCILLILHHSVLEHGSKDGTVSC